MHLGRVPGTVLLTVGISCLRSPLLPFRISLALPCAGLSGASQFLAESDIHYTTKYSYDVDSALADPL